MVHNDITKYNEVLSAWDKVICDSLVQLITKVLPESENKLWHGHPVWFLDGNPIVGYSKQKAGIKLLFWSGADFDEAWLTPGSGKFMDAWIFYNDVSELDEKDITRWLKKSREIQWDYKNIVKKRGLLERL